MSNNPHIQTVAGTLLVAALGYPAVSLAAWSDWWQTPEQKAASAFESGDSDTVIEQAPDGAWTGLGQYQRGDYDAASNTFEQWASEQRSEGNHSAANRALYNRGLSEARSGRYQQALDSFDQVLSDDPNYTDAAHNRTIVEQLLALEQQQQQQQPGDDGEQGENSSQQDQPGDSSDDSSGQSSDESGESGESTDPSGEQQETDSGAGENSDDSASGQNPETNADEDTSSPNSTDAQQQQAADDASRALAAEAAKEAAESESDSTEQMTLDSPNERPMSETEQATEQLLRRIPDDPAGLLRRKLEQSHRSEFPEVRDAAEPW